MNEGTRLCFFPTSFPDESVFSLISRYHRLSGNADDRDTLRELFGKHAFVVTSHLPSLIDTLVRILPSGAQIDAQGIIDRHTTFPYYRPFLTERQISLSVAAMKGDSARGLKTMMGLVACQVGGGNPYRFCAQCAEHDDHLFGQPYWHRAHQLPAVHICHEHGTALYVLDASWVDLHRHRLFLPTTQGVIDHAKKIVFDERQSARMRILAVSSKQVLDTGLGAISQVRLQDIYRDLASDLGLAHTNGRLRIPEFATWIRQKTLDFPTAGPFQFISTGDACAPDWALSLLRKARKSTHPLKHLVLLHCLNGNWGRIMVCATEDRKSASQVRVESTSQPPTPSSALHQQLRSMLVDNKNSLRRCAQQLGLTTTTLRIEATRLGIQVSTRPKALTEARLATLREALTSTIPLKTLAQRYQVSVISLYRILRMYPDVANARIQCIFERERNARRKKFSRGLQTSFARRLPDYAWLHKHDRPWLTQAIKAAPKKKIIPATRIKWDKRDQAFAEAVKKHSEQLYAMQKPIQVTRASIGRSMRQRPILEKHLFKLPLTVQALAASIESTEDFQCRRLQWAALQTKDYHPAAPAWLLLRVAGLKTSITGKLLQVLEELLK